MGGNITIKLPRGRDPQQVAGQLTDLLSKAGYQNIQFNFKQAPKHDINMGNNRTHLIAQASLRG